MRIKIALFFGIACLQLVSFAQGQLVITEIMQNPAAVSDSSGEWFEIYNAGPSTVELLNFRFEDESTASEFFTVSSSLLIASGDYLVFGINDDLSTNGNIPVDYEYSGLSLGNSSDGLVIRDTTLNIIDEVVWDNGLEFPDPSGASMMLIGSDPLIDNALGSNWAESTNMLSSGDFGTPGSGNFSAVPEPSSVVVFLVATTILARKRRLR